MDVADAEENFKRFEQRLASLDRLQRTGLFVAVSGPSRCGKTSLINRCLAHASAELEKQKIEVVQIDFTGEGRNPNLSVDERTQRIGEELGGKIRQSSSVFNEELFVAPQAVRDVPPRLEEWTSRASQAMKNNSVAIILMPSTANLNEIATYWSSVYPRMLVFVECPVDDLSSAFRGTAWEMPKTARWICLETRLLLPGESREFIRTRIDINGRGQRFPDLSFDALEGVFGGDGERVLTIGAAQRLLYEFYDHCLRNGRINETMDAEDLKKFISLPARQRG